MPNHELFDVRYHPMEVEKRYPSRPLGPVSDFVVVQMPQLLVSIQSGQSDVDGFASSVEDLIGRSGFRVNQVLNLKPSNRYPHVQARDLAALDLKMLEAAIVHNGGDAPERLVHLVDEFAQVTNQPPGLTYEELIYINPRTDMRTFTAGEVGKSEYDFYVGHRMVEDQLAGTIRDVQEAGTVLDDVGTKGLNESVGLLTKASAYFYGVIPYLKAMETRMPTEHFKVETGFRRYFNSRNRKGKELKGPSGAFTAGIPIIELHLAGENLPEESHNYLANNFQYFPRGGDGQVLGRVEINTATEAVNNGETLTAIADSLGNPPELMSSITELSDLIREFRGYHFRLVKKQLPEAVVDQVAGSGGERTPGTFLRERMKIRHIKGASNGK